jgi:crotonobetainyl-CoA:carnitine CoA-transferase CaiB-like acyl-CoA transferase
MLGDYGAEVIKIEPLDGEIARAGDHRSTATKPPTSST